MSAKPVMTIAGRLRLNFEKSHLKEILTPRELALATTIFYAGFASCLEAMNDISAHPEDVAVSMLKSLHQEVNTFGAAAEGALHQSHPQH